MEYEGRGDGEHYQNIKDFLDRLRLDVENWVNNGNSPANIIGLIEGRVENLDDYFEEHINQPEGSGYE